MCMIVGDQKAQALWMECCSSRLAKITKNMSADELKQVWIIEDFVAVAIAIQGQIQARLPAC